MVKLPEDDEFLVKSADMQLIRFYGEILFGILKIGKH